MEVRWLHVLSEPTHILEDEVPSLKKEFWTLCMMTDSKRVIVETIPYSNIGLTHCL